MTLDEFEVKLIALLNEAYASIPDKGLICSTADDTIWSDWIWRKGTTDDT